MDSFKDDESNSFNMTAFNLTLSFVERQLLKGLDPNCFKELLKLQDNATQECIQQFLSSANQSLNVINESETNKSDNISNIAEATTVDGDRPFIPMFWIQLAWSLVFGLMVIVAVVGNVIVIFIVLAHKRMRTVTNFFLLNLTIADLVTATFNAIFNFVYMLNSHWPFGQSYCVINNFIANLTIVSSVFTITATSIDRYVAIVHPLKPRMSKKTAISIIVIIWFFASLFALPTLLYSKTFTYQYAKQEIRTICMLMWPDGPAGQSAYDNIYNMLFLLLTYIVPMASMAITYSLIGRVLWGSKGIGEETELQKESIKSKRKVVRMLITVVVIFALCWLPYHVYFLYTYYNPEVVHLSYIQHVYLGIYWLAMSNSMYNWIIYCWMNKRFRNYFKRYLLCASRNWRELPSRRTTNGTQNNNQTSYTRSPSTRYDAIAMSANYNGKRSTNSIYMKETRT